MHVRRVEDVLAKTLRLANWPVAFWQGQRRPQFLNESGRLAFLGESATVSASATDTCKTHKQRPRENQVSKSNAELQAEVEVLKARLAAKATTGFTITVGKAGAIRVGKGGSKMGFIGYGQTWEQFMDTFCGGMDCLGGSSEGGDLRKVIADACAGDTDDKGRPEGNEAHAKRQREGTVRASEFEKRTKAA